MSKGNNRAQQNYDRYLKFDSQASGFKISDKRSVWVPDTDQGYLRGTVEEEKGGKLKVKLGDGAIKTIDAKKTEPANPSKFDGVEDCSELSHLNNATVFHNLRVRYVNDLIHTSSGLFLVVINPYKWIQIYTPEIIEIYRGKRRNEVHPHVFAIADEAYRAMIRNHENQSMLITGESGAGKTENTKKVIQYLAHIAGKGDGKLEQQILQANPMLEAFGNAKTNKNDNSSRFGKYIRIQFNAAGIIIGSTIQVYLLEKSRVVHQGRNERNFHIFYQILKGNADKNKYHLLTAHEYGFFTDKDAIRCRSLDDAEEWDATLKAMNVIGLSSSEQENIFRIVSGIMHCGNIAFESSYGGEGAKIAAGDSTQIVAEMWGVDKEQFEKSLIRPRIKAGLEIVEKHLTSEQAKYSVNAMCKSVYERLFLWLIKRLNETLAADYEDTFFGVLDIAGFEIFEVNSFEQLCINFTNEKLQQFFNDHMFKLEQEEYAKEKIKWKYVDFGVDSQMTIDLIEKKPHSIMSLLDEESIFPRATDKTLITKLHSLEKKSKKYAKVQFKELNFTISHYAGDVIYDVTSWIDKNKDPLQDDIASCIRDSNIGFVSNLFTDDDLDARAAIAKKLEKESGKKKKSNKSGGGASFMTVATTYQEQLGDLMRTLRATAPSFVRCIIPNLQKKPGLLQADLVLEQLACNGVLEGIRISRMGFPNRIVYAAFCRRYYLLHPTLKRDDPQPKEATETIMKHCADRLEKHFTGDDDRDRPLWQFGLTKVFFRHGVLAWLEEQREAKLSKMVVQIQAAARGWIGRNAYKKVNMQGHAAKVIQKNVSTWLKFREWIWWQCYVKSKPLLKSVGLDVMIQDTEKEIDRLETAMKEVGADKESLGKQLSDAKSRLETLTDDLAAAKARHEALDKEVGQLEGDVKSLNEEIESQEDYLKKLRLGNSATDKDLADAEADLKDAEDKLTKTQKENVALTDETADQKDKIADLGQQLSDLEGQNDGYKKNVLRLEDEIREEEDAASSSSKQGSKLKEELDELEKNIAEHEEELSNLQKEAASLTSANKENNDKIDEASDDLKQTKEDNDKLRKGNKQLTGDIEDTQMQLDRATRSNTDLTSKQKRTQADLDETTEKANEEEDAAKKQLERNKTLEGEISGLEGDVESLEESVRASTKKKSDQTNRLAELRAQLESLEAQIEKLKKRIAELEAELKATEDKLDAETVARNGVSNEVKSLEAKLKEAQEDLEDAQSANSKLSKAKTKLEKDIKDAQDQVDALEAANKRTEGELKEKRSRLTEAEDELEAAKRKGDNAKRDLDSAQDDLDKVKGELEDERDARDRAERGAKQATANLKTAQDDLAKLEERQSELNDSLRKKKQELEEAQEKAAQAGAAEERRKAAQEAKKTQQELNDVLDQIAKAESAGKSALRRKGKLESLVAELKKDAEAAEARKAANKKRRADAEDAADTAKREAADLERTNKKAQQELDDVRKQLFALRDAIRKAVKVAKEGKVDKAKSAFVGSGAPSISASRASSRPAEALKKESRESSRLSRYSRGDH